MTTMTPIAEILANATGSVDFGTFPENEDARANFWLTIIRKKASDTGFGRLVDAILENGFDHNSPIGWYDGEITEGHHRLVAAILLCLDEVPTSTWGGGTGEICAHCDCTEGESYSVDI